MVIHRPPQNSPNSITTFYPSEKPVNYDTYESQEQQTTQVAEKIAALINEQKVRPVDILVVDIRKYEQGEFLAAFQDGAFLQINYEFDLPSKNNSYLAKMNLCYLPPVTETGEIRNEYIRIDYSNSPDNSFFHAYAHVHIGFRNAIRIPIDEVLLFSEFIKLILYLFYPEYFKSFCSEMHETTNTQDKSVFGKLTKDKILTKELERFFYWKTA